MMINYPKTYKLADPMVIALRHALPGAKAGATRLHNRARYGALNYAIGLAATGPGRKDASLTLLSLLISLGKIESAENEVSWILERGTEGH
jgi:hypothetical protein